MQNVWGDRGLHSASNEEFLESHEIRSGLCPRNITDLTDRLENEPGRREGLKRRAGPEARILKAGESSSFDDGGNYGKAPAVRRKIFTALAEESNMRQPANLKHRVAGRPVFAAPWVTGGVSAACGNSDPDSGR